MRIKHIYITKEGEPMANPEMDLPKPLDFYDFEVDDGDFQKADEDYNEALEKYHSGLLPFEDKQEVEMRFCEARKYCECGIVCMSTKMPQPDTLIPVDLEVEVVEQCRRTDLVPCALWIDGTTQTIPMPNYEYRKVLRIKP